MTAKEAAELIDRTGMFTVDGLKFEVQITDVREVYGRTQYNITPVGGSGTKWVMDTSVRLIG